MAIHLACKSAYAVDLSSGAMLAAEIHADIATAMISPMCSTGPGNPCADPWTTCIFAGLRRGLGWQAISSFSPPLTGPSINLLVFLFFFRYITSLLFIVRG